MSKNSEDLPRELDELGERLRDERPSLDPLAYDRGQQHIRRTAAPRRRSRRSSLAVALCLSLGAILSSGGAGLAVSGLSSTHATAVQAQYPTSPYTQSTTPTVAGTTTSGYAGTTPQTTETLGTAPASGRGTTPKPTVEAATATSQTQAAGQVGATQGSGSLPFTGFAAIPVMLLGLGLLMGGLALRRRRASDL